MKYVCSCGNPTDNKKIIAGIQIHICDDCEKRIEREVKFQSEGERFREKTIICPHCGYEYEYYDSCEYEEGEEEEIECNCCGHKFVLEVEEIRYYSTKKSVCEMPG